MIAEAGLAALWFAAALAALQLLLSATAIRRERSDLMAAVRPVAMVQGALAALSMTLLIILFLRSDMSVVLVATNSHSAKPLLYKFAGAWGNHEGSMLLWVTVLGLAGAAVALFERRLKSSDPGRHARRAGDDCARFLRLPALLLQPVRAAQSGARPTGRGSIPCCRTPASPSTRRRFISAMSESRSLSRSRSARW